MLTHKETHSLEDRRKQVEKWKEEHPTKIPIIIEPGEVKSPFAWGFPVSPNSTMVHIARKFRSKFQLNENVKLFFLVGGEDTPVTSSSTIGELHQQYKDKDDGFLYINYYGVTSDNLI